MKALFMKAHYSFQKTANILNVGEYSKSVFYN